MAIQTITDAVLTDSTGQQILTAIQDLAEAVQPTNVYVDIAATLSASNWSSATPSVYTWTNSKVTGECAVEVFFATGASSAPTPYIEYEKGVGSVIFYAPTGKPTVDLPVVIRIINAETEIASDIDADMVATDAISGASNVQEALTSVNSSIGQLNSKVTATEYRIASYVASNITRIRGQIVKINNFVSLSATWTGSAKNIDNIVTLPAELRPSSIKYGSGIILNSSNEMQNSEYVVNTDGTLRQAQSTGAATNGSFAFVYTL